MATTARLKRIKQEVNKASDILNAIDSTELMSLKFMNRRDRIVNEINAFSEAIQRRIIPNEIQEMRIVALDAELLELKQKAER